MITYFGASLIQLKLLVMFYIWYLITKLRKPELPWNPFNKPTIPFPYVVTGIFLVMWFLFGVPFRVYLQLPILGIWDSLLR